MIRLLFRIALLAYPRAFRRRFGAEMWSDFQRVRSHRATAGTLGRLLAAGLGERWAATVRFFFWPNHRPHLY